MLLYEVKFRMRHKLTREECTLRFAVCAENEMSAEKIVTRAYDFTIMDIISKHISHPTIGVIHIPDK